ncbi:MAG TPA: sigma-70 family RNA polymerase sigma factor [Planctomycetaceae bacterium]|nr:sigma-70 family RNA polymerase sigma factor [Planctomycetaceae bacterium]
MSSIDGDLQGRSGPGETRLEELLATAKTGSNSALGRALNVCRPQLLHAARRRIAPAMRPLVGASDLVQDAFVNATKAFPVFRGGRASEFLNWLRRILSNRIAEMERRDRQRLNGVVQVAGSDINRRMNAQMPADHESPSGIASSEEIAGQIRVALLRLPDRQQEILHLRFDDGLNFPQIGERLELSEDATRMQFLRAVERLRREFSGS